VRVPDNPGETLMEAGAVKHAERGRPRLLPCAIIADKGYSDPRIRLWLSGV
jgi:hypothetical protein